MHNREGTSTRRRIQQVQTCRDLVPGYAQGFRNRLLDSIQRLGGRSHCEGACLIREYQSALRLHVEVLLGWQLVPAGGGRRSISAEERRRRRTQEKRQVKALVSARDAL